MDEIFGYLPPTANPPSKKPMMTMLKQGRAFGLGCLLATQNPVDLDYKALSNIGTWWLGRLQTERDKLRVLDGLEGVAGAQNARFDRAAMEKLLSALGNRIFLMNNVHEDGPVLFHVRWAMSYLCGPLTRSQIKSLMDPKRAAFAAGALAEAAAAPTNPMVMPAMAPPGAGAGRPLLGPGVTERFAPPAGAPGTVVYRPHLLRAGSVRFSSAKASVDESRTVADVRQLTAQGVDWQTDVSPPVRMDGLAAESVAGASFAELPGFAMNAQNYRQVEKDFADWLYREQRLQLFRCPAFKVWSKPGEPEGDFRGRLAHQAREERDAAVEKLRAAARKKAAVLEQRLQTAAGTLERQKAEASGAKMQAGISVLGSVLGAVLGRKSGIGSLIRGGGTAMSRASSAYKQQMDVGMAADKVTAIQQQIAEIEQDLQAQIAGIEQGFDPTTIALETETIAPAKSSIKVDLVALLWLPCDERGAAAW